MHTRLVSIRQRLDNLEGRARTEPVASDDELKANLSQHLCVLTSGYIEESVRTILSRMAAHQSSPRVANYVIAQLNGFQNAKAEKVLTLLGSFDSTWRTHFEDTSKAEMMSAVDSIVNNRHQIAHGKQVTLSLAVFSRYYAQVKLFIDQLDGLIGE